jgi:hypothetical protein
MSAWSQLAGMIQARIGAPAPPVREVSEVAATRPPAQREKNAPDGSRLLSEREIVRALWMYRYDRRRRVPIKALAEACQLHRSVLYDAMLTGRVSERARAILSTVIGWIADGRLRFQRVGQVWDPDYRFPPDPLPPPQPRLVRAADFVEWSRCQSCGSLWFSPVVMNGAPWFFCDGCLPEAQWPAVGARPPQVRRRRRIGPTSSSGERVWRERAAGRSR